MFVCVISSRISAFVRSQPPCRLFVIAKSAMGMSTASGRSVREGITGRMRTFGKGEDTRN